MNTGPPGGLERVTRDGAPQLRSTCAGRSQIPTPSMQLWGMRLAPIEVGSKKAPTDVAMKHRSRREFL